MKVTFFLPAIATFMATAPDTFSVSAVKILTEIEDPALAVDMLPTDFAQLETAAEVDDFLEDDENLAQIDALSNWAAIDDDSSEIPEQTMAQGSSYSHSKEAEADDATDTKEAKANRMWEQPYTPGVFGMLCMWLVLCVVFGTISMYYYVAT